MIDTRFIVTDAVWDMLPLARGCDVTAPHLHHLKRAGQVRLPQQTIAPQDGVVSDQPFNPLAPEPGSYDDPIQAEARQKEAAASLRNQRLRNVEAAILSTAEGREWLWAILTSLHTLEKRIAMSGSEREVDFWDGQREAGLRLFQRFVDVDPENFALMFKENRV